MEGQYRGPVDRMRPEYIADRCRLSRIRSCTLRLVYVMWQSVWGTRMRVVSVENGSGGSSPGCASSDVQSTVRPSMRGGVPVFRRPRRNPNALRAQDRPRERRLSDPPGGNCPASDVDQPVEKRSRSQNHARSVHRRPVGEDDPGNGRARALPIDRQILHAAVQDIEVFLTPEKSLHGPPVKTAIRLRARSLYGGAFSTVENPELDSGPVDRPAHDAVERVDLANQMPLAEAADRRVARHFANGGPFVRHKQNARANARGGGGGLATCVPSADNDHFV